MAETVHNKEKKYPIKPYQLITERFDCPYCWHTHYTNDTNGMTIPKTNTKKCAFCGAGSREFWRGLMIGLAEDTKTPVALIERVNCERATKALVLEEKNAVKAAKQVGKKLQKNLKYETYQVIGNTVYHCINFSSAASKGIANSQCYISREDETFVMQCEYGISPLNIWCRENDIKRADDLFAAMDNSIDYLDIDVKTKIRYRCIVCEASGLYEIFIPIYSMQNADGPCGDIIGILIVGQIAIGEKPDFSILKPPEDSNSTKIKELREKGWEMAVKNGRQFANIKAAFEKYGSHIQAFKNQAHDRLEIRVTDFLHGYQAELLSLFNKNITTPLRIDKEVKHHRSAPVKTAIRSVFEKLCCKGGMSNSLLKQHGGYPIRSSLRKRSRKGATQFGRFYGAYIALCASATTNEGNMSHVHHRRLQAAERGRNDTNHLHAPRRLLAS